MLGPWSRAAAPMKLCYLGLQDKVQALIKAGKWEEVFLEKINVLLSMRQVLETCFDMLEKTSSPMDGVTLQNILRWDAAQSWGQLLGNRPQDSHMLDNHARHAAQGLHGDEKCCIACDLYGR